MMNRHFSFVVCIVLSIPALAVAGEWPQFHLDAANMVQKLRRVVGHKPLEARGQAHGHPDPAARRRGLPFIILAVPKDLLPQSTLLERLRRVVAQDPAGEVSHRFALGVHNAH